MKNTLRLITLVLCLIFAASFMVACGNDNTKETETETTAQVETTPAIETVIISDEAIGEDAACEVAFADAGIPATAADNLSVKMETIDNVDAYVIYFEWSGFSYTYTVDALSGSIIDCIFE